MAKAPFRSLSALAVLACVQCTSIKETPKAVSATPVLPLTVSLEHRTVRDAVGRSVLLRGYNFSGLEFGNFVGNPNGPKEEDFTRLQGYGANVLRLAIAWNYIEPTPGVIDESYFEKTVDPLLRWAEARGMFVVLEMHQFYWSPCTGGNGAPAWVCDGHSYGTGADGSYKAQTAFWSGVLAPDGRSLLDHYLLVWGKVALRYKASKTVIGFDFMNEPMDTANAGTFEHASLYPFYRRAKDVVRKAGAQQLLVLEPPVIRNLGLAAKPESIGDDKVLYAPHLYTTTGGLPTAAYSGDRSATRRDYERAEDEADAYGAVLWVGEFGGVTSVASGFIPRTALGVKHAMEEQNARILGGALWAYFPGGDVFSVVDQDKRECAPVLDAHSVPYPRVVAGLTDRIEWNPQTGDFTLTFHENDQENVPDPTVIYIPKIRHYPTGFNATVDGLDRTEWNERDSALSMFRDPNQHTHTVRIQRRK